MFLVSFTFCCKYKICQCTFLFVVVCYFSLQTYIINVVIITVNLYNILNNLLECIQQFIGIVKFLKLK